MRLNTLLNHYCDLSVRGEIIGKDDYNRPEYGQDVTVTNVQCRLESEITETRDEQGENMIKVVRMIFAPDVEIDDSVVVTEVRDNRGNVLNNTPLEVALFTPVYGRLGRLHHYEAQMKAR